MAVIILLFCFFFLLTFQYELDPYKRYSNPVYPPFIGFGANNPTATVSGLIPGKNISIQYSHTEFGPNFVSNSYDPSKFIARLSYAGKATSWDNQGNPISFQPFTCGPYPSFGPDNTTYNGTFVIADILSGCAVDDFVINAQNAGAAGLIFAGKFGDIPNNYRIVGWFDPRLMPPNYKVKIPCILLSYDDGEVLKKRILTNTQPLSDPLEIHFEATGPLQDPEELEFVKDFAKSVVYCPFYPSGTEPFTSLNPPQANSGCLGHTDTILPQDWINTQTDPCTGTRISAIICKGGHISSINMVMLPYTGTIPPSISKLKYLERIYISSNSLYGDFPDISNSTQLKVLTIQSTLLTSLKIPTLSIFVNLESLVLDSNKFQLIPSGIEKLSNLQIIQLANNPVKTFPQISSPDLFYLNLKKCQIQSSMPDFTNFTNLIFMDLSDNDFYSSDITQFFDNKPQLVQLFLSNNEISGGLPHFSGTSSLKEIYLSNNKFSSKVPLTWNLLSELKILDISLNQIQGPFDISATSVTDFIAHHNDIDISDVSWNQPGKTMGYLLSYALPPSLINIDLSFNKISGIWSETYVNNLMNLQILNLAHNNIPSLPNDMFALKARIIDLSFNNISGNLDMLNNGFDKNVEQLKLEGNPKLISSSLNLPAWVDQNFESQIKIGNNTYVCPSLIGNSKLVQSNKFSLTIDPNFYSYSGCQCDRGFYNDPPFCQNIPTLVEESSSIFSSNSFSDTLFGSKRLLSGVDITWVIINSMFEYGSIIDIKITLKDEFKVVNPEFSLNPNILSVSSSCPPGSSFNFLNKKCSCLSGKYFSRKTNKCEAFDFKTDSSDLVFSIDSFNQDIQMVNKISVISNVATLRFKSSKLQGQHFIANFTKLSNCPSGYIYFENEISSFVVSSKCEKLFQESIGVQTAVYVVSSLCFIALLLMTTIVIKKRQSLIIKSASFPFCFIMLINMMILCLSSIFYAISPEDTKSICHLRPWFTAFPLTCILSALLVKADRIRKIFTSKELVVQSISNKQLAQTMLLILTGQFALLIWFSASNFSSMILTLGSGTTSNLLVYSCQEAHPGWIAAQFSYISLFLLAGVLEAWSVRKVPSAFNEGPHIASTLLSLTVLLIILIPVQFMVGDNPNALVIIRGIGQVLITIVMSFFLFGPKLYYIFEGKENDKAMSSMGSSKSSSSFSSSSSVNNSTIDLPTLVELFSSIRMTMNDLTKGNYDVSSVSKSLQTFKSKNSHVSGISSIMDHVENFQSAILQLKK